MESRSFESRGHRLHYFAAGGGPGTILIHGALQRAERWAACGYLESLGRDFRVLALDLLGHGQSDKPHDEGAYLFPSLVQDVVELADAEGLDAFHLWGYSLGARVAAATAQSHPARVLSLTAGGQVPVHDGAMAPRERAMPLAAALREADWDAVWAAFGLRGIPEETRELLQRDQDGEALAAAVLGGTVEFDPGPVYDGPKLCYLSALERALPEMRQVAERAGAEVHVLEGRDHGSAFQDRAAVEPLFRAFVSASVS